MYIIRLNFPVKDIFIFKYVWCIASHKKDTTNMSNLLRLKERWKIGVAFCDGSNAGYIKDSVTWTFRDKFDRQYLVESFGE
jgi:hypothetical protein